MKTGMLYDADIILATTNALRSRDFIPSFPPLVCDPVCISTSGHKLLDSQALQVLVDELFPLAKVITPNKAEAEMLLSHRQLPAHISNLEEMITASRNLLQLGAEAVLLKGGHIATSHKEVHKVHVNHPDVEIVYQDLLGKNMEILQLHEQALRATLRLVADVLCEASEKITLFVSPYLESTSTHGTGCTLSAAIASNLARGLQCAS